MQITSRSAQIPAELKPYFQEYEIARLHITRDANLIIQRHQQYIKGGGSFVVPLIDMRIVDSA